MARTPEQALAEARRWTTCRVGMCLWTAQEWYAVPHVFPDAISQARAVVLHPGAAPAGVPVFYEGGRHGHVAISSGGGRIRSTDCPANGRVAETDLRWPERRWGYRYIGWSTNIGGVELAAPDMGGGDMALSEEDINRIAWAVWSFNQGTMGGQSAASYLVDGYQRVVSVDQKT